MSYEPTNWKKGDKITSARLNKIENGIQGNDSEISDLKSDLSKFPFTADSALKRTAHNDGAISANTVKNLFIYDDSETYRVLYIQNLFQNSTKQEIVIQTEDGKNFARYQKVASPSSSVETCDLLRYNSAGSAVTSTVCGRITVDWSKIGASLVGCTIGDFNILDCCILRKSDFVNSVTDIAEVIVKQNTIKFPFTSDSTMNTPSGSVDPLSIKNIYINDVTGNTKKIYMQNCFQTSSKKDIQFNLEDGTPYCGTKEFTDLEKYVQTMPLYKYGSGTNLTNVQVGVITVDWNTNPYVVGASLGQYNILDCCIFRTAYANGKNTWLPISTIHVSNVQQRIYFNEIFQTFSDGYMSVTASGATYPEVTYTDRYIEFNVASNKTITLTLTWYEKGIAVTSKTITVVCKVTALPTTKLLCIGDSWTYDGYMQGWVADNNQNVTLYGTIIPSSGYRGEGRYGWTIDDYFANTTKNGQTNPFFNPSSQTFDFSYYMANHPDYNDVTVVNIFLGMNNAFDASKIPLLLQMAESVKSYNSNIVVTVMGAPLLAENNSGAGRYMQNVHTFNKNFFDYNVVFFSTEKQTGIYFVLPSANLDSIYDFETEEVDSSIVNDKKVTLYTNNVHPAIAGYKKLGIAYSAFLRNLLT